VKLHQSITCEWPDLCSWVKAFVLLSKESVMKKNKIFSSFLIGTCLITLASCGSDSGSSSGGGSGNQQEEQDDQGIYRAVLKPLNTTVAPSTSGTVEIRIEGDDVTVMSNVTGAPAGVKHLQNVTLLTACPTTGNDVNNDSFVDILEAAASAGPILIPLDSNLSTQLDGNTFGPIANGEGSYVYRRSTTLTNMLADLRAPDPDSTDPYVKLPEGQDLNLAGKVVIIHGVGNSANLPNSVSTAGDLSAEQALPIACGELVRVTNEDGGSTETGTTTGETGSSTGTGTTTGETGSSTGTTTGETGTATTTGSF
jgi:hypothetical protein